MDNCTHLHLSKLSGSISSEGKTYKCDTCSEQFHAEVLIPGFTFGTKKTTIEATKEKT